MNVKSNLFNLLLVFACVAYSGGISAQEEESSQEGEQQKFEFNGLEDFENWATYRGENNWALVEGKLVCSKRKSHILQKLELPDASKFNLAISYENRELNFVFGLGAPADESQASNSLIRIETWEDSLVLNAENDFAIIYETFPANQIELSITYDRPNNSIIVEDANGKQLCKMKMRWVKATDIPRGVFIMDKIGKSNLKINKLTIVEGESAGLDPDADIGEK